jgi:PAS domain S-box-containing protein
LIRVLLVDDEPVLLLTTKTFLEKRNPDIQCDTCQSASEALDKLAAITFDAIISDYEMPAMDGISFLKEVRARFGDIPFVLFTGRGREEVVIEALNNGADFYLQKGVEPASQFAELGHKVRHAVARIRAEESLRISEEMFGKAFYSNPHVMTISILETGEYVDVNEAFESIMGYSREEAIGKTSIDLGSWWDPDDRPPIVEILNRDNRIRDYVADFKTRSGEKLTWKVSGDIIELQGRPHVIWAFTDITARKQAEEALKESEKRLRKAQRAGRVGVFDWNLETGEAVWTSELEALFGLPEGSFEGNYDGWGRRVYPDDLEQLVSFFQEWMHSERLEESWEYRFFREDGELRWMEAKATIIRGPEGQPLRMIGTNLDITERKQAEESLKMSEDKYRQFFEQDLTGDLISAIDGRIIACNPAFVEIFGFDSIEEALHSNIMETYATPEDWAQFMELLHRVKKLENFIRIRKRKDGSLIYVVENVYGRFDENGELIEIRGYCYDDSERTHAEEALKEANKKLNLLTSITRHDILNQVTALKGYLHLVKESQCSNSDGWQMLRQLDTIADTIRRQITFTGDYQHMGEQDPMWQNVERIIHSASGSVRLNGAHLNVTTDSLEIFGDPMLEKVFFNLLDNTRAHGGEVSEVRVTFHTRGNEGVIVIEDDGIGIPVDMKESIFDRGVGTITGYGLFLVKEILGITGMTIRERGEEGKGARFEIEVPPGKWRIAGK